MIGNTEKIYPLWGNLGLLVLRLFVAYLVIQSGYGKLFTEGRIEGFSVYLTSLGVPFPLISAYLAVLTEFFAPMFYVIGFGTRLASIPLVVTFAVATFVAKGADVMALNYSEFGMPLGILISCLVILIYGAGSFSVGGSADQEE